MLTLRAAFQPATFDAEKRTVELVWTTGAKGLRRGWDGDYYEELEVSKKAIRLDRLNNGAPFLAAHESYSLRGVVGVVERAWIKGKEGRAIVRFSERAEAAEIMRDVQAGILQNISVGYTVHKYERIRSVGSDGKPDGGIDTYRAIDWEPMEISIVPIGFDDGAKVRSFDTNKKNKVEIITRRDQKMSDNNDQIDNNETDGEIIEPATPATRAAVRAERARTSSILTLCRKGGLGDDFAATLIRDGVPLAEARAAIIDEMANAQSRTQPSIRGQWIEFGNDYNSPEAITRAMGEAIACRINPAVKPSEAAKPYMNKTLLQLAADCLQMRGVNTRGMGPSQILERAYAGTSDYPAVFGDAIGRELMRNFELPRAGAIQLARPVIANDFRNRYPMRVGDAPTLEKVSEHGEVKRGYLNYETAPAWKIDTYSRIFPITRQALINDDLSAFDDIGRKFGIAAREKENQLVIGLLTSNGGAGPNMGDGNALFHTAAHKNLAASGGTLNATTLASAYTAMRLQQNLDGTVVDIVPRYILVPVALALTARQLLATITPTKSSDVNVFADGSLELIVDARLDAISSTRWYLVASPAEFDGLEAARLGNTNGATIETRMGWDVEGMEVKARIDFGCGFVDWRSWYANNGA